MDEIYKTCFKILRHQHPKHRETKDNPAQTAKHRTLRPPPKPGNTPTTCSQRATHSISTFHLSHFRFQFSPFTFQFSLSPSPKKPFLMAELIFFTPL